MDKLYLVGREWSLVIANFLAVFLDFINCDDPAADAFFQTMLHMAFEGRE